MKQLKQKILTFIIGFSGLLFAALPTGAVHAEAVASNSFVSGSFERILNAYQGRSFMLVMWSLECAACRKELGLLAATCRDNPDLKLVLISTDDASTAEAEISRVLAENGLQKAESWIFAGANQQKLRYEVDPIWYGEIPRTYFYIAGHQRAAFSGMLREEHLEAFLASAE